MARARFEAELIEGHKGVATVLVPFNPEEKSIGDHMTVILEPTSNRRVLERAILQSKRTTQPKTARVDVTT